MFDCCVELRNNGEANKSNRIEITPQATTKSSSEMNAGYMKKKWQQQLPRLKISVRVLKTKLNLKELTTTMKSYIGLDADSSSMSSSQSDRISWHNRVWGLIVVWTVFLQSDSKIWMPGSHSFETTSNQGGSQNETQSINTRETVKHTVATKRIGSKHLPIKWKNEFE